MAEKKLLEMTIDEFLNFKSQSVMRQEERDNQIKNVAELVKDAMSKDGELQLKAFFTFGKILTGPNAPWKELMDVQILKRLIYFLDKAELPHFQLEALGIVSSLVEHSEYIPTLVASGIVSGLVNLIQSSVPLIRAMATAALGNIAQESVEYCEFIIKLTNLEPLLPKLSKNIDVRNASWILRIFCDKEPQIKSDTVKQVLDVLEKNLDSSDDQILIDTCSTLASLCKVATSKHELAVSRGLCRKLIELLDHQSHLVVEPALETLAKIATGDQMEIEHIVEFFMLPQLVVILATKKYEDSLKINVCKILYRIASTGIDQAQEVVGHTVYMLSDVFEFSGMELKMEIARTIAIAVPAANDEAIPFVREKVLKPLCDVLNCPDLDLVSMCLAGIEYLLKAADELQSQAESVAECSEVVESLLKKIKRVGGKKKIRILKSDKYYSVVSTRASNILDMRWPLHWDEG